MDPIAIITTSLCVLLLILVIVCMLQIRNLHKALEEKTDTLLMLHRTLEEKQESFQKQQQNYNQNIEKLLHENQKQTHQSLLALGNHITQNQEQKTQEIAKTINTGLKDLEATITAPLL